MRTILKSLTLSLGLLAVSSANAQMAYFVEAANSYAKPSKGSELGTGFFFTGAYKFSDDWKAGFEVAQSVSYMSKGESALGVTHDTLRFPVTRSNLKWLSGWKTSFTTRWNAPTTGVAHQAGGLGSILLRPAFTLDSAGAFGLLVRPQVTIALVDSGKQEFVVPGETAGANSLASWALEIIPWYTLAKGMDLSLSSSFAQGYTAAAAGKGAGFGTAVFNYEFELGIPVETGPVTFAAAVGESKIPVTDLEFFSKDRLGYTLYVRATF